MVSDYLNPKNISTLLKKNKLIEVNLIYNNTDVNDNITNTLEKLKLTPNFDEANGKIYKYYGKYYCNLSNPEILDLLLTQHLFVRYMENQTPNERNPFLPLFPLGKIISTKRISEYYSFGWMRNKNNNKLEVGTIELLSFLENNNLCLIVRSDYQRQFLLSFNFKIMFL